MKKLIIGIILIICTIGLVVYDEYRKNMNDIHDIVESESKEEGGYAYLNATYIAGMLDGDENSGYFVVFGDGYQYIVYMNNKDVVNMNKYLMENPEDSYKIKGVTKLIPSTMEEKGKKFVKEWLDNNHTHEGEEVEENHSHDITTDEFYHYFGYVYLDIVNNSKLFILLIYILGITGVSLVLSYINTRYHLL